MKFLALLFLLSASAQASAPDPARVREVAHSQKWLRLLHYKSYWFRGFRSSVGDGSFFFSPDGARDPEKELVASVEAFRSRSGEKSSKLQQPLACAFPARFRFLNEQLGLGLKMPECEKWNEFLGRFHGHDSVTLVFSTAFPNNPASMFGHSFLRINAKGEPGKPKQYLLDYGLSYAAQVPDDENNFLFVWFGLTGGYVGTFSSLPYYAKVAEYGSSENRDLWEYNLDFSPDETWWLLANVWELEVNSSSPYYFFDENCSYEILTLLEVAKPEWNVASYFYHNIPAETVKRVAATPGAVKSVKFRPSLFKKLLAYGDRLKQGERESFFRVIEGRDLDHATVPTLDAAAQYFHYVKQQKSGKLPERELGIFQRVLVERAQRGGAPAPEPEFDQGSRPDWGHHASRISVGGGMQRASGDSSAWFQELGFKFAYHDLLNHDVGFVPFSEISFPNVTLRYLPAESRFWVQRLEVLTINSLSPWSWLKNSLSWRASIAYEVPASLCSFCHVLHGEGNVGLSHAIAGDQVRAYELLGIYAEAGKVLSHRLRVGPKLTAGLLANATARWKQQVEVAVSADPWKLGADQVFSTTVLLGQSYFFSPELETRFLAKAALRPADNARGRAEGLLQFLYYF